MTYDLLRYCELYSQFTVRLAFLSSIVTELNVITQVDVCVCVLTSDLLDSCMSYI